MVVAPLVILAALAILGGFFGCWGYAIVRLCQGRPLLPFEPRRQVPWGLVDLALVIFVGLLGMIVCSFIIHRLFGPGAGTKEQPFTMQQNMVIIAADTILKLVVMLVVTTAIMLRTGCTARDLGISSREAGRDILIGLAGFCMLAPIVYAIQAALTLLEPYKHPLIEMMEKTPDLRLFAMLTFSAAILAPLSEEWAFRVLLQGWLEKVMTFTGRTTELVFGGISGLFVSQLSEASPPPAEGNELASATAAPPPAEIQWIDPTNPFAHSQMLPPPFSTLAERDLGDGAVAYRWPEALWKHWVPILASSLIFGLMHYSHGLAWIPLTILSLGLGFIYQRTHRILPSMTVHFCLNALSMAAFWVQMFEAPQFKMK